MRTSALEGYILVSLLLVSSTAQAQDTCSGGPTAVPAFVVTAAAASPGDFASALAEVGVCAGFVVRDQSSRRIARAWRHDGDQRTRPLKEAISVFQSTHPQFRIEVSDGVFLIKENGALGASELLSKNVGLFTVANTPAIDAFRQAVARVVPGMVPTAGAVGSALGRPGDPPLSEGDMRGPYVTVHVEAATIGKVIEEIGRAAPGVVWMLAGASEGGAPAHRLFVFMRHGMEQSIDGVMR